MGACFSYLFGLIFGSGSSQYIPIPSSDVESNQGISSSSNTGTGINNGDGYQQKGNTNSADVSKKQTEMTSSKNIEIKNANASATVQIPSKREGGKASKAGFFLKYELGGTVGVGSTSTCHRCTRKSDGVEFACKVIDKQQIDEKFTGLLDQFYIEIKALQSLEHRNIISLVDVFETSAKIYMVMEMMNGGELFDYVVEKGTLSEEEASLFVRKITSAVAHMHNNGIIHRDLKPENLLLTSKDKNAEVKLIDFGLAKIVAGDPSGAASSFLGTKGYLAPEMLQRNGYDKAIDMWALGIIVFVLLCGCLPFDDDSSKIPSESAARKKFTLRFPRWSTNLSASAKDLLHNLLDVNPKTRYTAEQALNHPWVSGKTVVPNNYLNSPSILGERRRETKTPSTPQMESQHNKLMMANSVTAASYMPTSTSGYGGQGHGNGHMYSNSRKQNKSPENSDAGRARKNSL